jgi:hypothetical protein
MKRITLVLLCLLSVGAVSIAENSDNPARISEEPVRISDDSARLSDDPLLDARIRLEELRLRYTEKHPKVIDAEALCAALEKYFTEAPAIYHAHVKERLEQAELEEAELALRYSPQHPKYILVEMKLDFLRKELQRS